MSKNWKSVVSIVVGIVVGVFTAGIGTAFFSTTLGMGAFWGGVASGALSGAMAGAAAGGVGGALYGQNIGQSMLRGAAFGALSGAVFGGINQVGGKSWNWKSGLERVTLSAAAGGGINELAGGSFIDGAAFAGFIAGADFTYRAMLSTKNINQGASMKTAEKGGQPKDALTVVHSDRRISDVGYSEGPRASGLGHTFAGETGPVMSSLGRYVPGFQGMSLAHDISGAFLGNTFGGTVNSIAFNFETMPVMYGLNAVGSLINDSPGMIGYYEGSRGDR